MLSMSVPDIARVTGAELLVEGTRDVSGEVVIDSRAVGEGGVFVAFAGERVDGNAYLAGAARSGAAAPRPSAPRARPGAPCCARRETTARSSSFAWRAPGASATASGSSWA